MIIKDGNAIEYFNKKAIEIFKLFSPLKEVDVPTHKRLITSLSHRFFKEIPLSEATGIEESVVDFSGDEISRSFYDESGNKVGLYIKDYSQLKKFIDQLYKRKNIQSIIKKDTLISIYFKWVKKKYFRQLNADINFVQFFESEINSIVKKIKISIPIDFLEIDNTFEIGNVKFEYYTKELFDKIDDKLTEGMTQKKHTLETVKKIVNKLRKNYQGKVFASLYITAEPNKAVEIAKEETEKALSALKFFSPSAFFPETTAYFGRKGHILLPIDYIFVFDNEIPNIKEAIEDKKRNIFMLDNLTLKTITQSGLLNLSKIIQKKKKTAFEELIMNCIFTYSLALSRRSFHEKIIFVLSSAEIAFLKDYNEPIQQNLAQRLAFFVFKEKDQRKSVIRVVKESYDLRSKFLHHGSLQFDYIILKKLQFIVWNALKKMISMSSKFMNKEDFLEDIENIIYS